MLACDRAMFHLIWCSEIAQKLQKHTTIQCTKADIMKCSQLQYYRSGQQRF